MEKEAAVVTILLQDWKKYGITERVRYHFHLTDALGDSEYERRKNIEGNKRLLECIPFRTNRKHRRTLKNRIQQFNQTNTPTLPLPVTTSTRVYFAYETTRIAFVIDAASTLISEVPLLDRIPSFIERFTKAMTTLINDWEPYIFITLTAVLPDQTCLLLTREYPLTRDSIPILIQKLQEWLWNVVENEIARKLSRIYQKASNFSMLWEAAEAMLSTLSDAARPLVVLITDGSNIECPTRIETPDVPLIVIDVSRGQTRVTDDRELLYRLSSLYLDEKLLDDLAVAPINPIHTLRLNLIQRYTLLFVSPLSPGITPLPIPPSLKMIQPLGNNTRSVFSTYILNPVRIVALLLRRVKEGFRVKQYGQSTADPDKVFVQLVLPIEGTVVIHYELSYQALPNHSHMLGFGHIRMEVSGDYAFVQAVKQDFLHPTSRQIPPVSNRICSFLKEIRQEDTIRTYLAPIRWADQLVSPDTPFVRRLAMLTGDQRERHFRRDRFDCVCVGKMSYDDPDFLRAFLDGDNGEEELRTAIAEWATLTVVPGRYYLRVLERGAESLPAYAFVVLKQNPMTSRLFTLTVDVFEGVAPNNRFALIDSLKDSLSGLRDVRVLEKQMSPYLVGLPRKGARNRGWAKFLESQHDHESWELVYDSELLPLLMKRRSEIGKFFLLDSSETHAFFAKLAYDTLEETRGAGDLVQYQIQIQNGKVVIHLRMESESATFSNDVEQTNALRQQEKKFTRIFRRLKRRDQDCANALSSRRRLLSELYESGHHQSDIDEIPHACVERLLRYTSRTDVNLRYFSSDHIASDILSAMTEETFLSQTLGGQVGKLVDVDFSSLVDEIGDGVCFLVDHDGDALSIVHMSLSNLGGANSETYRKVSLFTVGISDLYSTRDEDIPDDESEDDHVSERLCVSDFVESLQRSHERNYACAAYQALVIAPTPFQSLAPIDIQKVLEILSFVETDTVEIKEEERLFEAGPDLKEILLSVIEPIDPSGLTFIFKGYEGVLRNTIRGEDDDDSSGAFTTSQDSAFSMNESSSDLSLASDKIVNEMGLGLDSDMRIEAPIFMKLMVDGQEFSIDDLVSNKIDVRIAVLVSAFKTSRSYNIEDVKETRDLPIPHRNAALEVVASLKAFVSETVLERLSQNGLAIQFEDVKTARKVLRRARNVLNTSLEIFFYWSKEDGLFPASNAPVGSELSLSEIFDCMLTELRRQRNFSIIPFDNSTHLVGQADSDGSLVYWCFLSIDKATGEVGLEIFHPSGASTAMGIAQEIQEEIARACHSANQQILLKSLHQSRSASEYMILPDAEQSDKNAVAKVGRGMFACPIVYEVEFDLFHRCATNPGQVARSLEATVLHIFALSNRRHTFVYKDESGSIFYLKLLSRGGGLEPDGSISLVVHGVTEPDDSVTGQLTRLLQKRLNAIASDMLSSVVTKNPLYAWRKADVKFVNEFVENWKKAEEKPEEYLMQSPSRNTFAVPLCVTDPGMFFLYFRQNLCGSTFFHSLTLASGENDRPLASDSMPFRFFYSNTASQVSPVYRSHSTLTERGQYFSRVIGTGVAIIEVILVSIAKSSVLPNCDRTLQYESFSKVLPHTLKVTRVEEPESLSDAQYCIQVTVRHTALKSSALHDWIELTLNQALATWYIETLMSLEEAKTNAPFLKDEDDQRHFASLNSIRPGLPRFLDIMDHSSSLPHPGALKSEHLGVIRSSSVASVSLDLLEKVILDQISSDSRGAFKSIDLRSNVQIIRLSRAGPPKEVRLRWTAGAKRVVAELCTEHALPSKGIVDDPTECPEYLMLCFVPHQVWTDSNSLEAPLVTLYDDVLVDDLSGQSVGLVETLKELKSRFRNVFAPSFGFVFSVKRNRRLLLGYNWSRSLFDSVSRRLRDREAHLLSTLSASIHSLELRTLGPLSPRLKKSKIQGNAPDFLSPSKDKDSGTQNSTNQNRTRRQVTRPAIRRPKLIGKSVDGSAMQAVVASRARASSNRFKNPSSRQQSAASSTRGDKTLKAVESIDEKDERKGRKETEKSARIQKEVKILLLGNQRDLRHHSAQVKVTRHLTRHAWLSSKRKIAMSVDTGALYLTSISPVLAGVSFRFPHNPNIVVSNIIGALGHVLTRCIPGSKVISIEGGSQQYPTTLILASPLKNLKGSKCFVLLKAEMQVKTTSEEKNMALHVTGRMYGCTTLRSQKKHRSFHKTCHEYERDCLALAFLSDHLSKGMPLKSALFDAVSLICDRVAKAETFDSLPLYIPIMMRSLLVHFPIKEQIKRLRSSYKIFRTSVVLKSYREPSIDSFDGSVLFDWMFKRSKHRDILPCQSQEAIMFTREILVKGTRSTFLLFKGSKRMEILVLSRTQGVNLFEWMLRDTSKVAIFIADYIAIEAAGIIFNELKLAAKSLRLLSLWKMVSKTQIPSGQRLGLEDVRELLALAVRRPLRLGRDIDSRIVEVFTSASDWKRCCRAMSKNAAFSPSYLLENEPYQHLFFLSTESAFILVTLLVDGSFQSLEVVEQEAGEEDNPRRKRVSQLVEDFLLHYTWSVLLQ